MSCFSAHAPYYLTLHGRRRLASGLLGAVGSRCTQPGCFEGQFGIFDNLDSNPPVNRYGTCPICLEPDVVQPLLLQPSMTTNSTPGLPKLSQRAGYKYPLALGNFPETDIILPITHMLRPCSMARSCQTVNESLQPYHLYRLT